MQSKVDNALFTNKAWALSTQRSLEMEVGEAAYCVLTSKHAHPAAFRVTKLKTHTNEKDREMNLRRQEDEKKQEDKTNLGQRASRRGVFARPIPKFSKK